MRREQSTLRIVGGRFRGRKLAYNGDPRTRPMKDRVREATFNRIGPSIIGTHAIDLFAGTGALGLEALSRGASRATMIELHIPAVRIIQRNVAALSVLDVAEVIAADAFLWTQRLPDLGSLPWSVFCSPPFDFYQSRSADMLGLIETFVRQAPPGSLITVETTEHFDVGTLPETSWWDVRSYPPAVIAVHRRGIPDDFS